MPEPISYSPNRLAAAINCGHHAAHLRTRGGSERTSGLVYGSTIDTAISLFFEYKVYNPRYSKELDFAILNSPQMNGPVTRSDVNKVFTSPLRDYLVAGVTDLTFESLIIEIKTGERKAWHDVQALCYATILNKPCRILYVTRGFHVTINPDENKLIQMLDDGYNKETTYSIAKYDGCINCPLKLSCNAWNYTHPLASTLSGLVQFIKSEKASKQDIKEATKIGERLRDLCKTNLDNNTTYVSDGCSITCKDDKVTVRKII